MQYLGLLKLSGPILFPLAALPSRICLQGHLGFRHHSHRCQRKRYIGDHHSTKSSRKSLSSVLSLRISGSVKESRRLSILCSLVIRALTDEPYLSLGQAPGPRDRYPPVPNHPNYRMRNDRDDWYVLLPCAGPPSCPSTKRPPVFHCIDAGKMVI